MSSLKARQKGLKIKEIGDEVIIFDPKNEIVHRVSRRQFVTRLGVAASASLLLPALESAVVPAKANGPSCKGRHATTADATGKTKSLAAKKAYENSVAKAEAICPTFSCENELDCVSTGHAFYPTAPVCVKTAADKWNCKLSFFAVCKCTE